MKPILFLLISVQLVEFAQAAQSCRAISNLVNDGWCNSNCNHVPAFCPATFCRCSTAAPGASQTPRPTPSASAPSPRSWVAKGSCRPVYNDNWCTAQCNAAPNAPGCTGASACCVPLSFPTSLTFTLVAAGFCAPRGLEFFDGDIYVSEAGTGGNGPCYSSEGSNMCYGTSGKVSKVKISSGQVSTVLSNLPSIATPFNNNGFTGTNNAVGPHQTRHDAAGNLLVLFGDAINPNDNTTAAAKLIRYSGTNLGVATTLSNILSVAVPDANSPADEAVTNPYDFIVGPPGQSAAYLIADAGADALWQVGSSGVTSLAYDFPDVVYNCIPVGTGICTGVPPTGGGPPFCCPYSNGPTYSADAVPVAIAARPFFPSEVYVAILPGGYYNNDLAAIFKFNAQSWTAPPAVFSSGFNSIVSISFDGPDSLYVLEQNYFFIGSFQGTNRLTRIQVQTGVKTVIPTNLSYATRILVDSSGWLWAANGAYNMPSGFCVGELVKVNLYPSGTV